MLVSPIARHFFLSSYRDFDGNSAEETSEARGATLSSGALFGWLHPAESGIRRQVGVVLCSPFGFEEICARRFYRHLAERLAANGFAALRFDYHGTGDSAGHDREPARVRTWIDSIGAAIEELKNSCDIREVYLFGFRLGATLAAAAAERGGTDINGLILWSPFITGKDFCRQAGILKWRHTFSEKQQPGEERDIFGFVMTSSTLADLSALDLTAMDLRRVSRALVLAQNQARSESRIVDHLGSLGVDTTFDYLPGYFDVMGLPHKSTVPAKLTDRIIEWLEERHRRPEAGEPAPVRFATNLGVSLDDRGCGEGVAVDQHVREAPVVFGSRGPLFGILTESNSFAVDDRRFGILLLNAGAIHHIGSNRLYVMLARSWALSGHVVFRLDLSGLGDSPVADHCEENEVVPRDALRDVKDAMDVLGAARGIDRFIILGLCSGAEVGFRTALEDSRVEGLLLLNAPMSSFTTSSTLMHDAAVRRTLLHYRDSIFQLRPAAILEAISALRYVSAHILHPSRSSVSADLANDEKDRAVIYQNFAVLSTRGIQPLLIYNSEDADLYVLKSYLNGAGLRVEVIDRADHTFSQRWAQEEVVRLVTDHLEYITNGRSQTERKGFAVDLAR